MQPFCGQFWALQPAKPTLSCPPSTHPPTHSPLLQLRANETPYDQLRTVPPERLLPVLLELLRASLPTSFDYLTNLTRTAIQNHLRPFMWLDRAFVAGERTCPHRYKPRAAARGWGQQAHVRERRASSHGWQASRLSSCYMWLAA